MTRLMSLVALSAVVFGLAGHAPAGDEQEGGDGLHPRVKMKTTLGEIVFELDAEKAPITVQNFIRYAKDGYYNGTIFHRVMSNFMIQGGGFTIEVDKKTDGLRPPIKNEWKTGLKNNRGTISMARTGGNADSATSQFFINVVDNSRLDQPQRDGAAYCAFGKVVEGMETVDKIRNTPTAAHPKYRGGKVTPVEPVVIESVETVGNYDADKIAGAVSALEEAKREAEMAAKAVGEKALQDILASVESETGKKPTTTASGLMYVVLKEGEGASPKSTDRVKVHYTGWLLDGTKFDSSVDRGKPSSFSLNRVIKGWTEGLGLMKVGGKWKFIIPPDLAYGAAGRPSIPGNSTLVFDVELLGINE